MKNDKIIEELMWDIHHTVNQWTALNDDGICDAYTDRLVEIVISKSKQLEKLYDENFEEEN